MILAPSLLKVSPAYTMPGTVMSFQQASGFESLLSKGGIKVMLNEFDKYAYVHYADIRTKAAAGQNYANQLPSVDIELDFGQTATYLHQVNATWNRRDVGSVSQWNFNLVEAQRYGMRQGIYQNIRNAALYGLNPSLGEGILNTVGATVISSIPADPFGNSTVTTIDNGWMSQQIINIMAAIQVRTLQSGRPCRMTICGPQRVLAQYWETQVVQVTQYQRPGAGTATIREVIDNVTLFANGNRIDWVYDDTLIGKGPNGYDAVIFALPEIEKPYAGVINTNEWADTNPSISDTIVLLADKTAPTEVTMPIALDATSLSMEMLTTSGWALRPECITILGAQYP